MIELITLPGRVIAVDIVGAFGFQLSAELTEFPIESGSTVSDHKILMPMTGTIEIQQTEVPLDDPQYAMMPVELADIKARTVVTSPFLLAGAAADGLIGGLLGKAAPTPMQVYKTTTPRDRGGELIDQLTELQASDETFSVTYRGRTFSNLSLIGVSLSYDRAGVTNISLEVKEIKTISLTTIALPDPNALAIQPAKPSVKAAAATGSAAEEPVTNRSMLKSLISAF